MEVLGRHSPACGQVSLTLTRIRILLLGDSAFLLVQSMNKQSFSFNDYLSRSYISQLQAQKLSPDNRLALSLYTSKSLGNSSEFRVAQRIQALDPRSETVHLYNAREYIPALLKRDNVILIGAKISNPWEELFDNRLNFVLATDFYNPAEVTNFVLLPLAKRAFTLQRDSRLLCWVLRGRVSSQYRTEW